MLQICYIFELTKNLAATWMLVNSMRQEIEKKTSVQPVFLSMDIFRRLQAEKGKLHDKFCDLCHDVSGE